jgi:hypothetical protein
MEKKRELALLESLLDEIPRLKKLPVKNSEYHPWDQKVKEILKKTFGNTSPEYIRYNKFNLKHVHTNEEKQQAYIDFLCQREMALKSIIQEQKKTIFQKIGHFFDYLWQVTVKSAFEGIINGLKKS